MISAAQVEDWVAPLIGGPLGGLLDDALVARNLPVLDEGEEPGQPESDTEDQENSADWPAELPPPTT